MGAKMFGARVPRLEDPRLLTGRGRYTDDFHLPGMLEAAFVRSPHSHAKINGIDTAGALAHPGVVAVYTAQDLPADLRDQTVPFQVHCLKHQVSPAGIACSKRRTVSGSSRSQTRTRNCSSSTTSISVYQVSRLRALKRPDSW